MIHHLVISGAGPNGLMQLGVLNVFLETELLRVSELKSVHAVSAGAVFACLLLMGIPNEVSSTYFINRPWKKWFQADIAQFQKLRGFMDSTAFKSGILPLMQAYDIPLDLTLAQLYEKTGVDLHIGSTLVESMTFVDISHKTHGSLQVLTACCMTCAIFPVFTPVTYDGVMYVDGCFSNGFPAEHCLDLGADADTVLAICMVTEPEPPFGQHQDRSWVEYVLHIVSKSVRKLQRCDANHAAAKKCKYFVQIVARAITDTSLWEDFASPMTAKRQILFDNGIVVGQSFLKENVV